ncbi:MAG TPA: hypothetical protein VGF55_02035 [Gemmataceae bacterium]|jgi:hypothetical protein
MPYTESKLEFHDRHRKGGEPVEFNNGWLLYPDGAACERSTVGSTHEPPADPHLRAKHVHLYWQVRAEQAVEEFNHLKQDLLKGTRINHRNGHLPFSDAALQRLAALRDEAWRLRDRERQAAAAVEEFGTGRPSPEKDREAVVARNRQWCDEYAEKVKAIEL